MANTNLTAERLRELLDYDPATGIFTRRTRPNNSVHIGDVAGSTEGKGKGKGYIRIKVEYVLYMAHRLAWLHVYGVWPEFQIDHINGIRNDNRIANLRDVSHSVNQQNRRVASSDSVTMVLGVSKFTGRNTFKAQIRVNGKPKCLGSFATIDLASNAYLAAKRLVHPGCTI